MKKFISGLTNVKIIAFGFALLILTGAFLLQLPFATIDHSRVSFLDALFTTTSATCVTGLVVYDTGTHWSLFGQLVILFLIQIGGLGFITIGVFFATYFKKNISLRQRNLIEDSISTLKLAGGVKLVLKTIRRSLIIELIGAIILSSVFIRDFGVVKGIYFGIFHSISAFCNAGFDLLGCFGEYGSLVPYMLDPVINYTIMALIVIGGIGFIVWDDILEKKFKVKSYLLQTKVVLSMTFFLLAGGTLLIFLCEMNGSLKGYSFYDQFMISLFQSVTCRTAGFNTFDVTAFTSSSRLVMMLLMFVGGSPGSTAGGIKTTTFAVIIGYVISSILNEKDVNVFNRRLESDAIKKASTVFFINIQFIFFGILIINTLQPYLGLEDIMFEVFSAMGTVGISTGITRGLAVISKIVIIILMYSGRVGTITFALLVTGNHHVSKVRNPAEKIAIG